MTRARIPYGAADRAVREMEARLTVAVDDAADETAAAYQPIDSDLTAIAALTTTAYGRALLELANSAAGRTALGLGSSATHAASDFTAVGTLTEAGDAPPPETFSIGQLTDLGLLRRNGSTIDTTDTAPKATILATARTINGASFDGSANISAKLDDAAGADDNTDLNASTSAHGLLRKLDNNIANYLNGQGAWSDPVTAGFTFQDGANIAINTTTGTKIGTGNTQKIGFFNATPVIQPLGVSDATGGATVDTEARSAINDLLARLRALGIIAT